MSNLQIKDLPDGVHAELRRRAREEGTTMREYVLRLLLADQALPSRREWLARVRERPVSAPSLEPHDTAALVRSDRTARDAELADRTG